jgi:nucleotide-binding universal stress UspA family protein
MAILKIKKILVPVDFSETSEKALDQASFMARLNKAELILLHVLDGPLGNSGDGFGLSIYNRAAFETAMQDAAKEEMRVLKERLNKEGVIDVRCIIETGRAYKEILKVAKQYKADVIFMGTHGVAGFREFVIGSNTFRVVSEATCPVLSIQKKKDAHGFKNILLPFRDKPHSREGVDYAIDLAKMYDSKIHILGINTDPGDMDMQKIVIEAEQIKKIADSCGVRNSVDVLTDGFVSQFILSYAKAKKSDLIVMMADLDKDAISEFIIGPVAQQMINHSPIPILSIQPTFNPKVAAHRSWY